MSTLKVNTLEEATAGGATFYTAKAWVTYSMDGTASITADGGVSSLTDLGTGEPQFNLDTALPAANGTCWNTPGLYSNAAEYAVQAGGYITATTHWKVYCGSSTISQDDWDLGYSGLIR
jgi:hypothetical protein